MTSRGRVLNITRLKIWAKVANYAKEREIRGTGQCTRVSSHMWRQQTHLRPSLSMISRVRAWMRRRCCSNSACELPHTRFSNLQTLLIRLSNKSTPEDAQPKRIWRDCVRSSPPQPKPFIHAYSRGWCQDHIFPQLSIWGRRSRASHDNDGAHAACRLR